MQIPVVCFFKPFCLSDTIVLCAGNPHLAFISSFCQFVTTLFFKYIFLCQIKAFWEYDRRIRTSKRTISVTVNNAKTAKNLLKWRNSIIFLS